MKSDIINKELIKLDIDLSTKSDLIKELSNLLFIQGKISTVEGFIEDINHRESLMSTYCGFEVAIPHAVSKFVKVPSFAFARTKEFSWGDDDEIVRYVFLLAIPADQERDKESQSHINIMSSIAQLALDDSTRKIWANASSVDEILESFNIT